MAGNGVPDQRPAITTPPQFCEYAGGSCDQSFENPNSSHVLFLYPNEPRIISDTIEEAIGELRRVAGDKAWLSWKDLGISGQIIFCQICKGLRFTRIVAADVTTLNFNLLFEIGYALGLGLPVLPIRDTTYIRDHRTFDELGILDTLGYVDFQNSTTLVEKLVERLETSSVIGQPPPINKEQPLYLIKSHIQNEGMVKLMSALKKSGLRFRSFDPRETPRLSLHEAIKQVFSSLAVVVHLVAPERVGAIVHNGRCAFVAGIALASGKHVLMLQETDVRQPIDYRDVIKSYREAARIPDILIPVIKAVVESLQESRFVPTALPLRLLEKVDLGDLAAENEIRGLTSYFVPTGQYNEAKRGRARLVVGRKGSGKTAVFYGVRSAYKPSKSHLVLDLKPEGHQFVKLREAVLKELSPGLQQHVLTAFWNYLLLVEIAYKIVQEDSNYSYRDPAVRKAFVQLVEACGTEIVAEQGDFSERLLNLVEDIVNRRKLITNVAGTSEVTQIVYSRDIKPLSNAVSNYLVLSKKEDVWLLCDNLDKGWPVQAATVEDVLLLRCLLEATRKLQRQFESRGVEFHVVVFIRNDIYEHLLLEPADRGKDTAVILDWNDPEVFKEIVRRRIMLSTELDGPFDELWPIFFDTHVKGEESFSYILARSLMRPRDVLRFARECIDTAVSRGREKVTEADIQRAEKPYSEDMLVDVSLELKDISPAYADVPYAFIGCKTILSGGDVEAYLGDVGVSGREVEDVVQLLLWFGILGIYVRPDEERYSYQYQHNIKKMLSGLTSYGYCIHPAFRASLGCKES